MKETFGLSRRAFLRGTGVTLALPFLDVMTPRRLVGAEQVAAPRRMLLMNTTLGLHTEYLNPAQPGRDYELSPYLEAIKEYRNDFTVFSGLSHPEVDGGHSAEASYLTGAMHPRADSFNPHSPDEFPIFGT